MLARVDAPAQSLEVEMFRVSEKVPKSHEEAVGYVSQPKDSDVLTPALRAASTQSVFCSGSGYRVHLDCREVRFRDMPPYSPLQPLSGFLRPLTLRSRTPEAVIAANGGEPGRQSDSQR
jgi:hypothetical protein